MKKLPLLFVLIASTVVAQTNTEVYLFDVEKTDKGYQLTNKKNISDNKDYDSQPYFYDNNTLLFASSRNGQTDILKYTIKTGKKVDLSTSVHKELMGGITVKIHDTVIDGSVKHKLETLDFLFKNYHVSSYAASFKKYGLGATEVYIYQNPKN